MLVKQMGGKLLQDVLALGKLGLHSAANQRSELEACRFETWCLQKVFTAEFLAKSIHPLVFCIHNIRSCLRGVSVECTFATFKKDWATTILSELAHSNH